MTPRVPPTVTMVTAVLCAIGLLGLREPALAQTQTTFRPPAVPLITHDPYFSIWSTNDRLTDGPTRHWTGRAQPLTSLIRVDGKAMRIMGHVPADLPAMTQKTLTVWPLRTVYELEGGGVAVTLTFLSPTIPSDLELVSRPVSYLTWQIHATDGKPHEVSVYFDASAQLAVNQPDQKISWSRVGAASDLAIMRAGTVDQPVLAKTGDNLRIDWGYVHVAVPGDQQGHEAIGQDIVVRAAFLKDGSLPAQDDTRMPRAADSDAPV